MTAPLARTHANALDALLTSAGLTVYKANVPSTPSTPYVVTYPDPGIRARPHLDGLFAQITLTYQVTAVGADEDEAMWAADKAAGALLGARPAVTGRSCLPVWQETAVPVQRDDDTRTADDRPLFYAVSLFKLQSQPA